MLELEVVEFETRARGEFATVAILASSHIFYRNSLKLKYAIPWPTLNKTMSHTTKSIKECGRGKQKTIAKKSADSAKKNFFGFYF